MDLLAAATILVVDDSLLVRRQVRAAVAPLALNVQEADDGASALDYIEKNPVSLLITDINMPRMNGLELIFALKERRFNVPCLVLTSESEVARLREAKEASVWGWIHKPFDAKHLASSVTRALQRLSVPSGGSV
jgi:two-component system chemotaxis response regulator CheY